MRCWRARRRRQSLNAFIALEPDKVRAAAREADQRRASSASIGPLHGVPLALKDNLDTADYADHRRHARPRRATAPSATRRDRAGAARRRRHRARQMQSARARLRDHQQQRRVRPGAQSLRTRPHSRGLERRHRRCGRGTACARAASARTPAAQCASRRRCAASPVFARPPGAGRRAGIVPISHTRDTAGPMTRSVADCALIDGVVTGGPLERCTGVSEGPAHRRAAPAFLGQSRPRTRRRSARARWQRLSRGGRHAGRRQYERGGELDAEAGFPIALYETVTDLNQYLKEHGAGLDYAGLVAKVRARM